MGRLSWSGSREAQRQSDMAFTRLKPKKKRKRPTTRPAISHGEYLLTKHWSNRRLQKLKSSKFTCERCGAKENLQVHHKHYLSKWREKNTDLETLCRDCHALEHENKGASDSMTNEFIELVKGF